MFSITQSKIAGLVPKWARFPGFSLLFDAPGSPFRRENGLEFLECDVSDERELGFFHLVHKGLQTLDPDRLLREYGFCALPSTSHHVTAYDVANVADLSRCHQEVRGQMEGVFQSLPSAKAFDAEFLHLARTSELATVTQELTFGYRMLRRTGGVLVVVLEPLEAEAFHRFIQARAELSRANLAAYGTGAKETFTPHLSLGYFLNEEGAELASDWITEWDQSLRESVGPATVTFDGVSLYGFSDMATFFRRP